MLKRFFTILFVASLVGGVLFVTTTGSSEPREENVKPIKNIVSKRTGTSLAKMFATGRVLEVSAQSLKIERVLKKGGKSIKEGMEFYLVTPATVEVGESVRVDYTKNGTINTALRVKTKVIPAKN